jgi:divalent metal cation (Fe/Co/Zn/Cd) transporter
MNNSSSFTELKKKINLMMDNALDQAECTKLIDQVSKDPKVQSLYSKEKNFRDYIKSRIARPTVSNSLAENIRNCIND